MAHEELLNAWLKDAYSMEMGLVPILKQHADDAKDLPEVQRRDEQHIEETKRHAEMVKACIERRGDSVSSIKTAVGGLVGTMQSVATAPFKDEPVKNCLSDYAAEQFEVACYKALVHTAEQLGDMQTAQVCRDPDRVVARSLIERNGNRNRKAVVLTRIKRKACRRWTGRYRTGVSKPGRRDSDKIAPRHCR